MPSILRRMRMVLSALKSLEVLFSASSVLLCICVEGGWIRGRVGVKQHGSYICVFSLLDFSISFWKTMWIDNYSMQYLLYSVLVGVHILNLYIYWHLSVKLKHTFRCRWKKRTIQSPYITPSNWQPDKKKIKNALDSSVGQK